VFLKIFDFFEKKKGFPFWGKIFLSSHKIFFFFFRNIILKILINLRF